MYRQVYNQYESESIEKADWGNYMLLFLGAGVSRLFDIPDMKGFIQIFDSEAKISQNNIYDKIKKTFGEDTDLEVLMTILEDLSKDEKTLWKSICMHACRLRCIHITTPRCQISKSCPS
jgi:hypothetical protein